jgi:lipoprotein-anchoring transpeptidase ErfK/SrfK
MQRVGNTVGTGSAPGRRVRLLVGTAAGLAALTALAACTSGSNDAAQIGAPSSSSSSSGGATPVTPSAPSSATSAPAPVVAEAAVISSSPLPDTKGVSPATPVTVSIAHGTLTSVTMTNPAGKTIAGAMAAGATSWHNTEVLGYGRTYAIVAKGHNAQGQAVTKTEKVTTLTPGNQTAVHMDRTGDYALTQDATYGVGIVPEMYFDESISTKADKLAAEKAMTVTTTPHVAGAWAWQDNYRALWRPQSYWPSGTKVTIKANIYGVKLGSGLYGQADESRSFTIGRSQITIAQDNAPKVDKVRVYRSGKLIRTMNTSMGKHSGIQVGSTYIDFHTMNGTYTVIAHEQPAYMSSASYGLPANAPGGYAKEAIYNATKISTDGIYLHQLNSTVWDQDHGYDVSHGCLNLNLSNSSWFFKNSLIGDPVQISGTHGPTIKVWQNGAWSVPWSTWVKGDLSNN